IVSTGGGAVLDPANRRLMSQAGLVVCLDARPETIHQRLERHLKLNPRPVPRPLLQGDDPLGRIRSLKASRQAFYDAADVRLETDGWEAEQAISRVMELWAAFQATGRVPASEAPACRVTTPTASYPIYVGWGELEQLPRRLQDAGLPPGPSTVISDDRVAPIYGPQVLPRLAEGGFQVELVTVPAGEGSKTLESARRLYDRLVARRAERGHLVLALGGGMVGDLAGFVAATFLRGLPLVHLPTSLLAMVDAAIGGKVAVNHPQAKNLIGAFYQPTLVLADVQALSTLPRRELVEGWAETIKHALIQDPVLLEDMEEQAERLLALEPEPTAAVIRRSAAIKAAVVSQDEREAALRLVLNYGHTVGHGLEAAAGYGRYLHGEAVAVGMVAAGRIGVAVGVTPRELAQRQEALLARYGLPTRAPGVDSRRVLEAMSLDKKARGGSLRWVLLQDAGLPVVRDDVPPETAAAILDELLSP
ncbi:MAG: 3-dehydroquinate synthase, partial [Chloroflexi bacterium]|nr:3-dehydroquinate synthase [Chloroflexota bacterium]